MKIVAHIAATLLGLAFIAFSSMVLFNLVDPPPPPAESLPGKFMAAFATTGYLTLVKVLELLGGILVLVPLTRNLGLLCLGPVIVNILAFHQFVAGDGIFQPILIVITLLALFLLWYERKAWAGLVTRS